MCHFCQVCASSYGKKRELVSSLFPIVIAIFITGVGNNLKTMNYGSVRISKQSHNYSNYSC